MKFFLAAALVAFAIVLVPGNVSAQSNDVIVRRLDALEKENAALRDRVHRLEAKNKATMAAAPAAASPSTAAYAMAIKSSAAPAPALRLELPVDWSGTHVGVFSSYALGRWAGTATDYPHQPVNGWLGGIAIGYDHQLTANWLIGVEADLAAADVKLTDNYTDVASTLRLDYLGTLRGRLGYARNHNLFYLTGGLAAGHLNLTHNQYHPGGPGSSPFQTSDNHIHYGYALGAGTQWAFLDNASLKIEYLWVNLPELNYVFPRAPGFTGDNTARVGWSGHIAKVGVDWLFH
jgi:outer membrane immunogenic protein